MRPIGGGRPARAVSAGLAAAVVVALAAALPPVAAGAAEAPPDPDLIAACGNSGRPAVTGGPGQPYRITTYSGLDFGLDDVKPSWWRSPVGRNDVQNLHLYAQTWLFRVLRRAQALGDAATVEKAVAMAAASYRAYPDTGRKTDFQWNEGTNLWRERSVTCMYLVTHDARLLPVVEATAKANLDQQRYYGPPLHAPHNHGLMANTSLLLADLVVTRPAWRAAAVARLARAAGSWVTPAGLGVEQSAAYHQTNVGLWETAVRMLRKRTLATDRPTVRQITATVARARSALTHLVMPDLQVMNYGDAEPVPAPLTAESQGVLIDRTAGVVAGRWSWTAPDDFYGIRFGPRTAAHGHQDQGEVVWWARGRPITADPGTATYVDTNTKTWQRSAAAHSTAIPVHPVLDPTAPMALTSARTSGAAHQYGFATTMWRVRQTRAVVVDSARDTLTVTDATARNQTQSWQLDPRWTVVSLSSDRHRLALADGTGGRLVLTTTGSIRSVVRGEPRPSGGWVFRMDRPKVPAVRIVVAGGRAVATRLAVIGPPLRPWVPAAAALPTEAQRTARALALVTG